MDFFKQSKCVLSIIYAKNANVQRHTYCNHNCDITYTWYLFSKSAQNMRGSFIWWQHTIHLSHLRTQVTLLCHNLLVLLNDVWRDKKKRRLIEITIILSLLIVSFRCIYCCTLLKTIDKVCSFIIYCVFECTYVGSGWFWWSCCGFFYWIGKAWKMLTYVWIMSLFLTTYMNQWQNSKSIL